MFVVARNLAVKLSEPILNPLNRCRPARMVAIGSEEQYTLLRTVDTRFDKEG